MLSVFFIKNKECLTPFCILYHKFWVLGKYDSQGTLYPNKHNNIFKQRKNTENRLFYPDECVQKHQFYSNLSIYKYKIPKISLAEEFDIIMTKWDHRGTINVVRILHICLINKDKEQIERGQ